MNKEVKLQAIEAGPFTSSQNRVSFQIPSDGVYDLSESYIELNTEITNTDDPTQGGTGIYPMELKFGTTEAQGGGVNGTGNMFNSAIVKNVNLRTALQGQVENVRRVDQISNCLKTLNTSRLELESKAYEAFTQMPQNFNKNRYGVYRDINKVGNIKSREIEAPLKIELKDLLDFCKQAKDLDTKRTGSVTINCELNIDKLSTQQTHLSAGGLWGTGWNNSWANIVQAGAGEVANQITTGYVINNLDQSRYFVGQKLEINAQLASTGAALGPFYAVISNITWIDNGADKGKLQLDFEQGWFTGIAADTIQNIVVVQHTPLTSAFSINTAQLVLKRLAKNSTDFDQIEYSTFSTQEDNGNGLVNFQRQYQIEGDSSAVIVVFPDANNDVLSRPDALESYRLRLDNEDLTDRNVVVNNGNYHHESPLYADRVNMTMSQMSLRLKNLAQNNGNDQERFFIDAYSVGDNTFNQAYIMSPVVQKPNEKLLQLTTDNTGGGVNKLTLFKHLPRVFSY